MIYDEKRDPSERGLVPGKDGRQGYRRKIKRSAEEIIRIPVLDAVVSEEDFHRVQQMIEMKRSKNWRSRSDNCGRYTYRRFLICAVCGSLIYTHTSKYDFYICKSHHPRERRKRALNGLQPCSNKHMLRTKLEPIIDTLLGEKLIQPEFVRKLIEAVLKEEMRARNNEGLNEGAVAAKLRSLTDKRQRVLNGYFDGLIGKQECSDRVDELDREVAVYRRLLQENASRKPFINEKMILSLVEPFADWRHLKFDDRRALLAHLCPEISVGRYAVTGLRLNLAPSSSENGHNGNRLRTVRSPSRAPT